MRFSEYHTLKSLNEKMNPVVKKMSLSAYYENPGLVEFSRDPATPDIDRCQIFAERYWISLRRPFYNVYPGVCKALKNTNLEMTCGSIGNFPATAICFPVGHEYVAKMDDGLGDFIIETILVYISDTCYEIESGRFHKEFGICMVMKGRGKNGEPYRCCFQADGDETLKDVSIENESGFRPLLSLVVGIILIARDPRFAEPILLNRDANKTFATPADKQRAIDRAIRNGRNGLAIGKDIVVSPHCRRPHFGIRWTGKGRTVPKLVPVNGCLVNRSNLFPIPTGYLGDGEGEVTQ